MESDSDRTIDSDELERIIVSSKSKRKDTDNKERNTSRKNSRKSDRNLHDISDSDSETDAEKNSKSNSNSKVSNSEGNTSNIDCRPKCKYGINCYQRNPKHIEMFQHTKLPEPRGEYSQSVKRFKTEFPTTSKRKGNMYGFYLTRVYGISSRYNDYVSLGIKELLSVSRGRLKASVQFSYMFDIPWLLEQYPFEFRHCPLTIVHGEQRDSKAALEKTAPQNYPITFCQAKLSIPFGTHHTKMMILLYEEGLRIVIHTANLVEGDWLQKTQGMWVSPLLPKLESGHSLLHGDSPTKFKADLFEYVSAYGEKQLQEWCDVIKEHDFSSVKVFLIASVPGRHVGSKKTVFGHLKLRKVLNLSGPKKDVVTPNWPVIGQFSSIGSLGSEPGHWLSTEWLSSLTTIQGSSLASNSVLKLVYPCVENVRISLEGYPAGASLPYSLKVATKQPYLNNFLHHWKSDGNGRSEASPHIKTYARTSPDYKQLAWFLVTSANLSKAAWGSLEKNGTQFMIRSYELGVLFIPSNFHSEDCFAVSNCVSACDEDNSFPLPFDVPLTKYRSDDQPWIWDIPHVHAPDRHGNKWCPPI